MSTDFNIKPVGAPVAAPIAQPLSDAAHHAVATELPARQSVTAVEASADPLEGAPQRVLATVTALAATMTINDAMTSLARGVVAIIHVDALDPLRASLRTNSRKT